MKMTTRKWPYITVPGDGSKEYLKVGQSSAGGNQGLIRARGGEIMIPPVWDFVFTHRLFEGFARVAERVTPGGQSPPPLFSDLSGLCLEREDL